MKKISYFRMLIILCGVTFFLTAKSESQVVWSDEKWPRAAPESQGMSTIKLREAEQKAITPIGRAIVIRRDELPDKENDRTIQPMPKPDGSGYANENEGWQIHLNKTGVWKALPRDCYAAMGACDRSSILVCPSLNLVIARKGLTSNPYSDCCVDSPQRWAKPIFDAINDEKQEQDDGGGRSIDWTRIKSPIIFQGDATTAYRDPAAIYHNGVFGLYFSLMRLGDDGKFYWYTAVSKSENLTNWTEPEILTSRDRNLNFSSPGNIIRYGNEWILCLQTYPTPNNETYGNKEARIWIMRSSDLETWSKPEMLMVKGPGVPVEDMGRMIDPYLVEDKDEPGKWWCFYKQNGASRSYSYDLKTWTYVGRIPCGENVCVLVDDDEYVLFHSPDDDIGVKRSGDLKNWTDGDLITLGQTEWPWAQGRLTAAFVLDLREEPEIGRCVMFFHGSSTRGLKMHAAHGHGTLAIAWSHDMINWNWPGNGKTESGTSRTN